MLEFYACAYLGAVLTAIGQVLMKSGARASVGRPWIRSYLNARTLGAYVILFVTTLLNTYAFRRLPLRVAVIVLPATFLFVGLSSFALFKERFSRAQMAGACAIILGIALYNF